MQTSVLIPTALCILLSEKWNSAISAILINWENTALYWWRSGQSLYAGQFYGKSQGMGNEWQNQISEMRSGIPEMLHKWILGKNISSRNALARAELVKSSKAPRRLGKPPPFTAEPQSQWGNSFSIGEPAFPKLWPPSPSAGLCWSKSLARALLNSRFHPFPHVPAQKYATWPTYSNPRAACQTPHLREGGQAGLLSGSSLTLFCTKSLCPWSTPGLASLTPPSWEA